MGQYIERLSRGEIGDEISLEDLSGLMVDTWGVECPAIGSPQRDEALSRLNSYIRAGILTPSRSEKYRHPGMPILWNRSTSVVVGAGERARLYVVKAAALAAFRTANDAALDAPAVKLWVGGMPIPSEASTPKKETTLGIAASQPSDSDEWMAERLPIAHGVLVLATAYHAAGAPTIGRGDAGGFSNWNHLVRRPILWLIESGFIEAAGLGSMGDPAACLMEQAASADPETVALGSLLHALKESFGDATFNSKDVHKLYAQGRGEIYDALTGILGWRKDMSPATIGRTLNHRRDRITSGLVLRCIGSDRNGSIWTVATG